MISMPTLTKAFTAGSTYVIDRASLRIAVLSGCKVITLGSSLELNDSIAYTKHVIDNIRVK